MKVITTYLYRKGDVDEMETGLAMLRLWNAMRDAGFSVRGSDSRFEAKGEDVDITFEVQDKRDVR